MQKKICVKCSDVSGYIATPCNDAYYILCQASLTLLCNLFVSRRIQDSVRTPCLIVPSFYLSLLSQDLQSSYIKVGETIAEGLSRRNPWRRQECYRRPRGRPPIARFASELANHQLGLVRLVKQKNNNKKNLFFFLNFEQFWVMLIFFGGGETPPDFLTHVQSQREGGP